MQPASSCFLRPADPARGYGLLRHYPFVHRVPDLLLPDAQRRQRRPAAARGVPAGPRVHGQRDRGDPPRGHLRRRGAPFPGGHGVRLRRRGRGVRPAVLPRAGPVELGTAADEPLPLVRAPGRTARRHGVRHRDVLADPGRVGSGPDRGGSGRHPGGLRAADQVPGRPVVRGGHPAVHRRGPARERRMTATLGWLGTGRMGTAIVGRLLDAGRPVTVWNRTAAKTAPLAARGARVAASLAGLGACDVVFTMVTGSADLEQVTVGDGGLLTRDERPAILVDCSTVSQEASARVRAAASAAGVAFLAAPVCGNPEVFTGGMGLFIVSGPADTFAAVRPDLERVARTVVHVGDREQARLVKLAHNLYLGMMVQSLVEVVTLAEKAGTSRAAFLEFFNGSALTCPWIQRRSPELADRDWHLTFTNE